MAFEHTNETKQLLPPKQRILYDDEPIKEMITETTQTNDN